MATTTNYSWTTPDDTALVKDGAAAIRTLGSSVDTTTKNLNPSTTLGDIEYRSSTANTNTRLGIGSTGNVLTVSGGVPVWAAPSAGSMTELATGTLSGSGVNITGISGAYTHLYIVFYNAYNTSAACEPALRFNNNSTGIYPYLSQRYTTTTANNGSATASYLGSESLQYDSGSTNNSIDVITVHNYASTAMTKAVEWIRSYQSTQRNTTHIVAAFNTTSAINQVNILEFSGNNFSGGTYIIYGVK